MSTPKPYCQRCDGAGYIVHEDSFDCEFCGLDPEPCPQCNGTGVEDPYESVEDWRYDR